jgi:hypothetical protein
VGSGQTPGEPLTLRPVTDDDEPDARQVSQHGEVLDLLLGRQPAHVAHERLPRGSQSCPQSGVAVGR